MLLTKNIIVFAFVATLAGCAGKDFVRPDSSGFKNGQTTYVQVVEKLGQPYREISTIKNDKTLKTAIYGFSSTVGNSLHEGVLPVREMSYTFYNDTLVGYIFASSWAEDNTDFNESKVKHIIKGKTTRAEVTALLGKPGGYSIYPLLKAPTGEAAVYRFQEFRRGFLSAPKLFVKVLSVEFDNAGVVRDVEFTSSGQQ